MSKRFLEPIDRVSEVLFGLIMVLTFTGSLSAAEAGRADVRAMLIGALGCNLAWGIIDGVFYLMGCLAEQGHERAARRALRSAAGDPAGARRVLADALPSFVASAARPEELDAIAERVRAQAEPVTGARLGRDEWLGSLSVFLWVFLTTFPVVVPFLFLSEPVHALRLSNAVALVLLYVSGHALD